MSQIGVTALSSVSTVLATLTKGFYAAEGAIISSIANFSISELLKLGVAEWQNINSSLSHFIGNLRAGLAWGDAMSRMLTELWNETEDALKVFVTDFVEAVGKVFVSVGLIAA